MSNVTRPRGPLPARVYWVRRLVLFAVVVLIGWLMVRWIDGGDSGAASPQDEAPAAATQSDDQTQTGDRDPQSGDKTRTARVSTVDEAFERPHEACDLTEVLVVPSVAEPAYVAEPVRLSLRISSASSSPCSLTLDAEHLLVVVSDGDETVWDSTHCEDEIPVRDLALQPHWSTLVDLTWSGLHSGRRCATDAKAAEPGTYTVQTAVLEGEPSDAGLELVTRPEPTDDEDGDSADSESESDKSDSDNGTANDPRDDATANDPGDDATEPQT